MTGARLRILRVLPFFAARFGGSVGQARAVSAELARRGHDVAVLTTDLGQPDDVPRDVWLERDGFRVLHATCRWPHQRAVPYPPPPRLRAALRAEVPEADVVAIDVGLALSGVAAGRAARAAGVGYVYCAQGALCPQRLQLKRWRKALFLRLWERPLLRGAAAAQALSAKDADDLVAQGVPRARIAVIPNGVPPAAAVASEVRARVRAQLGCAGDRALLLFVGRLHPIKGLDLAVRAAAPVLAARDARLLIAGPDEGVAAALARRAADLGVGDRVQLLGSVDAERRAALLAAADVFVHTSLSEGLPLAVLEAAAAGLPLWLTDACNVPEVAAMGAGTVDPPDVDALRVSLDRLLADVAWRHACAQNARRMVDERFSLHSVVDRLEDLYRSVAAGGGR